MNWNRRAGLSSFVSLAMAITLSALSEPNGSGAENAAIRPDLTGVVKDQDNGPIKDASVFIFTAGPKEGTGILCPSCYADCSKRTNTDRAGHFKIESLDPKLLFRILVVAKNHQPEFASKIDPSVKPVEVTLKPSKQGVNPDQQVKGRVVADGKPVQGAIVSIRGVSRAESTRFGANDDLDQVAVTDEEGMFVINSKDSFDAVGVEVEARTYAKGVFQHLVTGGKVHELKLTCAIRNDLKRPIAGDRIRWGTEIALASANG